MSTSEFLESLKSLNSERNDRIENRKLFDLTWHVLLLESAHLIDLDLHSYYSNQYHIYVCFNLSLWQRRRKNDDDFLILNIEKVDFSRRETRRRKMILRFHLTCLKQRENKSILWNKTHDIHIMIQTSKIHDTRKVIQSNKAHDTRKMIQTSKIHNVHKVKSMNRIFFYWYKITND